MNHNNSTIITERLKHGTALWLYPLLLAFSVQLVAHGGFEHVVGVVVKVEKSVLTVKTAKGNVDVRLNEKTEITRNDQKAEAIDLKAGTRVVVDVPEGNKEKIAHSVKIGVIDSHAHGAPK
jgi:hypothetical protein